MVAATASVPTTSGSACVAQARVAHQRRELHCAPGFDEHGAVQSGHPPLVLVFDVAVGAPAHHDDRDVVRTGVHVRGDVVLAGEPAVRAVTDELTVDVHGVHALGPADVEHHLTVEPAGRDLHRSAVHTGGVPIGQARRRAGKRHADVGVLRQIIDPLQGPVARHGDRRPVGALRGFDDRRRRHSVRVVEQPELPAAVE
jgi:hypothetical protein